MTPSASLLTFITSTGLAGLALTFLKDCAKACRPIASSLFFQRVDVVLPGRRALVSISAAYPCHLQTSALRVEDHSTPDGSADEQILFAGYANGHG